MDKFVVKTPREGTKKKTEQDSTMLKSYNNSDEVIKFYRVSGNYGCFSNFSPHSIKLQGKRWMTTEHYFQAQKFAGTKWCDHIRENCLTAMEAANAGRDRDLPLRKDWESVKDSVMKEALVAKFTQHPELQAILLNTGNATLVEHTYKDGYWGNNGDGTGKNMLGKLLMVVRQEIRASLKK